MFAENNRISHKQLLRQMVLSLAAPLLLCLIGWNGVLGLNGILALAAAFIVLAFYVIYLVRLAPAYENLEKSLGKVESRLISILYLVFVVFTGAFVLALLEQVAARHLVSGVNPKLLGVLALFTCSLGTHKGMQKRGRMAEVSYIAVVGGFVLLLVLAAFQGKISYVTGDARAFQVTIKGFGTAFYSVLCGFSAISLLPFLMEHVAKPNSAGKKVFQSLGILCLLLAAALVLLQANFGWARLKEESMPILPLMAGADLPGEVLARFDVIWIAILIYGLLFSLGGLLYYGTHILQSTGMEKGRWFVSLAILIVAWDPVPGYSILEYYRILLAWGLTPLLIILTLYVGVRFRNKV